MVVAYWSSVFYIWISVSVCLQVCVPVNSSLINCIAPFLTSNFSEDFDAGPLLYNLSLNGYVVESSLPGLSLAIRPNPIFTHINSQDIQQIVGRTSPIAIMVGNAIPAKGRVIVA